MIAELSKNFMNRGERPSLYFWRDSTGHEVDVILDRGRDLIPMEIKSAQTVHSEFYANLHYYLRLSGRERAPAALTYGGDQAYLRSGIATYPWFVL